MTGNVLILSLVLWPFIGALICYLTGWVKADSTSAGDRKKLRDLFVCGVIIIEFLLFMACIMNSKNNGILLDIEDICGLGIGFQFGGFRRVYVVVALLMWLMTAIFSLEYFEHYRNRNRYYFFYLLTLGATVGVFLSKDLYTAFIFFEIMSLTSYTWVAHEENPRAMRAAGTYLAVAVIGGLVMLMGILMLFNRLGTLEIDSLYSAARQYIALGTPAEKAYIYTAGGLILFGFGAKAGMFPLHIWLPKAHPVAPAPASALLSGILTKSGIYGVLVLCFEVFRGDRAWGTVILILGVITMFTGAVLAVFSIDLKRTLACSSMSQIGFILTGCAFSVYLNAENSLAAGGTVLYMVNHSLFKLVLFMCAGAVYMKLHKLNLNEIRGFGRGKWLLMICFGIGALGIMGVPLFSGYISKTLIHEGIVEYLAGTVGTEAVVMKAVEWIFLISGGMTIGYMIKLFVALFIEKPVNQTETEPIRDTSYYAMLIPSMIIVVCGVLPSIYIDKLSVLMSDFTHAEAIEGIEIFSLENLKGFGISLAIGAVVYLFIRTCLMTGKKGERVYVDRWPVKLDLENLVYRPVLLTALPAIFIGLFKAMIALVKAFWKAVLTVGTWLGRLLAGLFTSFADIVNRKMLNELEENKAHPGRAKAAEHFSRSDNTLRIVSASISFSMILLLTGLIVTLVYLTTR